MSDEVFIACHSLGAADGELYAKWRRENGLRVDGMYLLASPMPGNAAVGAGLAADVPVLRSIKNGPDYVTDVPFHIAVADLDYEQVAPFEAINEPPNVGDLDVLFRWHHIELYQAGCRKLPDNPAAAVSLADAADQVARLYTDPNGWDWINPVDGVYWAMKRMPSGAKLMIRRGSKTGMDWLIEDLDFTMIDVMGARASRGFWAGVDAVKELLDKVLA